MAVIRIQVIDNLKVVARRLDVGADDVSALYADGSLEACYLDWMPHRGGEGLLKRLDQRLRQLSTVNRNLEPACFSRHTRLKICGC